MPSEVGEYMAQTSFWTLDSEQAIVCARCRKRTPLARHLTAYFLRNDVGLSAHFKEELETYLRGIAGALGVVVKKIEVDIPTVNVTIPPRPELSLCEGSVALANGLAFARRQADGTIVGIYPKKPARKSTPRLRKTFAARGYDHAPKFSYHSTEIRPWKLSMCVASLSGTS